MLYQANKIIYSKGEMLLTAPRESLINKFEMIIVNKIPEEYIQSVVNCMIWSIEDFEINDRCTDVAVVDTNNEQIIKAYTASLMIEGKSSGTISRYTECIKAFCDFINKDLSEATSIDLRRYLAMCLSRGVSERTCESRRSYINTFYNWMLVEEYTAKNDMLKVKTIKYTEEKENPLSDTDISMIRDSVEDSRDRALFEVLISTGLRCAELCSLKINDIDINSMQVHVKNGKGGKERYTYMSPIARMYLSRYLVERKHCSDYAFCNNRGGGKMTKSNMYRVVKNIGKVSGVDNLHPHRLRHTFASQLAKHGMAPQEIQTLLGHKNLNTTMIYVSTSNESIKHSYMKYVS